MKKAFLIIFLFIFPVLGRGMDSTILSLEGELWYGAYTAKGDCGLPLSQLEFQPYPENTPLHNLAIDNRSNQAAPLLLSNLGRYIWSEHPFAFQFVEGNIHISSEYEEIVPVSAGSTLREAYLAAMKAHFPPTGRTPDPLMFRMPQYNTWIELGRNQNQADILKYAEDVVSNGFPVGVFMIDDQWSKDYGNFEFKPDKFPDPKAMVEKLHEMGFKIMLWVTPFVSPDSPEFRELQALDALVKRRGTKFQAMIGWWNGYSACINLENEAGMNWLKSKLLGLQEEYGIDGFKFDAADFYFYVGASEGYYDTDTNGPVQAQLMTELGSCFPFSELRASWKSGNVPVAQRLQDKGYSWDELKLLIPDMVSAALIGYPFTCPDMIGGGLIGTFENITDFDQELMLRSAEIQAMMPMMQFSVAPWRVLDSEHLGICRDMALRHTQMGDYIYALAREAAEGGEPIVRHLEYAFPHQGFERCNDQFMLGERYMVTPAIEKGTSRVVKLPKGLWKDELGRKYRGGRSYDIEVPIDRLPYFEKVK